ncbi:MAG TPA: hypothetical protein VFE65_14445 [Pseudonocardia sp.]|nr:hypothetical protein [Pseudonocardia sp.]
MTDDELVVNFALARLDHSCLELEEIAALLVRQMNEDDMLAYAARNLAERDELRGAAFDSAVECVIRIVLKLRDGDD